MTLIGAIGPKEIIIKQVSCDMRGGNILYLLVCAATCRKIMVL